MLLARGCALSALSRYNLQILGGCATNSRVACCYQYSTDSHDDFLPKFKTQSGLTVKEQIEQDVKSNPVVVYMKGVPQAPMCGFSNMVCRILDQYGIEYGSRNVLADPELRQGIKEFTSWPTIPQVFVGGEFIGGCDIVMEMHKKGELKALLEEEKGASKGY